MIEYSIALTAILGILGEGLFVATLALDRRNENYHKLWQAAVTVLLLVVGTVTAISISKWAAGPPPPRGALNPGGPSGSVLAAISYVAIVYLGIPGSFISLSVLGFRPSLIASPMAQRRSRLYLAAIAFIAAIASILALRAHSMERTEARSNEVHQTPFERFKAYRNNDN